MEPSATDGGQGSPRRATFIVRLSKAGQAVWHGVVELVGGERRRHVAGRDELGEFIDRAFAESADDSPPRAE